MKKLLLKTWLLLACLLLGVGTSWAEEQTATLTFTAACKGSGTDDKGNSWTITSDASESTYDNTKGIHYGTGSAAVSYLKLTNSSITGTVSKIVVNASGASSTSAKLDVKVGGSAFGSQQSLTSSNAAYTFNGSASGNIEISLTQTSAKKALYVKSVAVTYSTAADSRTAVNITDFSATSTTLIKGETTNTSVTNDQNSWTVSYTYESSNTDVATISNTGVITAVAKGTARITASLDIANDDANWKKGATSSKTIDITVNNPSHTYTFYSNGTSVSSGSVEEGVAILFPADPSIDDVTFMGWATAAIDGTQNDAPTMFKSANMGTDDVEFFAVFATEEEGSTSLLETVGFESSEGYTAGTTYNSSSYTTGSTGSKWKINYGAFSTNSAIIGSQSAQFRVYSSGGGYGQLMNTVAYSSDIKKVEYSAKTANTNGQVKVSYSTNGSSWTDITTQSLTTTTSEYSVIVPVSGVKYIKFTAAGTKPSSGNYSIFVDGVKITAQGETSYSDYCTTVSLDPKPTIVLSAAELAEYVGNTNTTITASVSEGAYTGALEIASSAEAVATASISEGTITINALTAGSATIAVTAPAVTGFRKATATIAVTVSEKLAHGLAFSADGLNLTVGDTEFSEPTLSNPNSLPVVYSLVYAKPENEGKVATINAETGKITLADPSLSTETQGAVTVKASTVGDNSHAAGEVTYNLVVARKVTTTSWSNEGAAVTIDKDEIATLPTASNDGERNLFYESSNTEVATIDNTGAVTFVAYGTTTITVKTNATAEYAATSATYELTFAPRYTVTFKVYGQDDVVLREETTGAGVTAPEVEPINGKAFRGWAEAEIDGTTNVAPTFVTTSSLDGDKTLYAVFATASGGSTDVNITMNDISTASDDVTIACAKGEGSNDPAWTSNECRIYASNTITISANSTITAFSLTFHKQGNKDYIETITASIGDYISGGVSTSSTDNKTDTWSGSATSITLTAGISGQRVLVSGTVTLGSANYSDYCTTVPNLGSTTLTISSVGYATYYNPTQAFTMPDDCEGYVFTAESGLECAYEAEDVVPAGEPLVIYTIDPGTKTLVFTTSSEETYKSGDMNDLCGAATNMTAAEMAAANSGMGKFYALSLNAAGVASSVGFYWVEENGAAFAIGAGKAYLALPAGSQARSGFAFNEDVEAIDTIDVEAQQTITYNMNGIRVDNSTKGFVVRNGKKCIIK